MEFLVRIVIIECSYRMMVRGVVFKGFFSGCVRNGSGWSKKVM